MRPTLSQLASTRKKRKLSDGQSAVYTPRHLCDHTIIQVGTHTTVDCVF
jgi:hypothetical protein